MIDSRKSALVALRYVLRPVVRFCLRKTLTIQDVQSISKSLFVELAREEIEYSGKKPNTSKISIVTGLRRKEVERINKSVGDDFDDSPALITRVIGQWLSDPEFVTATGEPRIVSYKGSDSEFYSLVQRVSTDVRPGSVLAELERLGAVEESARGLRLLARAYEPRGDLEAGFQLLSTDADDLILAVEENVHDEAVVPNLHATTEYDNICSSDIPEVRQWLLDEGMRFHKKVRAYLSQFDKDLNPDLRGRAGYRVVLGSFSRITKKGQEK
jgi:hypothetical protein